MKSSGKLSVIFNILIGIVGLVLLFTYLSSSKSIPSFEEYISQTDQSDFLIIGAPNGDIKALVATSSADMERGLSGRSFLTRDHGMLFVFPEVAMRGFWMKNMSFPIDIIWIDQNKTVTGLISDVEPGTYPNVYFPNEPIKYVLELNAGYAREMGIATGTPLNFMM